MSILTKIFFGLNPISYQVHTHRRSSHSRSEVSLSPSLTLASTWSIDFLPPIIAPWIPRSWPTWPPYEVPFQSTKIFGIGLSRRYMYFVTTESMNRAEDRDDVFRVLSSLTALTRRRDHIGDPTFSVRGCNAHTWGLWPAYLFVVSSSFCNSSVLSMAHMFLIDIRVAARSVGWCFLPFFPCSFLRMLAFASLMTSLHLGDISSS